MLVVHGIKDEDARVRIARQTALLLAAVQIHKQEIGLHAATLPIDVDETPLLNEARDALDTARKSNGHDVWGVLHHPCDYEPTRRFLRPK